MSIADDGLRALLQRHLPRPDWLWTPIESGATHSGIPDAHWAHAPGRQSGWAECKATNGWAVAVRPHQLAWARTHVRAGVRLHVLVRARGVGSSGGAGDSLWVLPGAALGALADVGLRELAGTPAVLGCWRGPPRSWDWGAVARLLLT